MEYSLYCHIPFCKHRCAYCDFNTYAGQEAFIPAYVEALCREIEITGKGLRSFSTTKDTKGTKEESINAEIAERKNDLRGLRGLGGSKNQTIIKTIFFGGGTPSLLAPRQFEQIFRAIHANFSQSEPEISLEANPGTVTLQSLQALREIGFNRVSFGVQSAHPQELRQLERIHDFYDVIDSVKWARQAGFDNMNLDLIFGLPEQSLERWQTTVKRTVDLNPEHFSLYALTIEHGTPFGRWAQRGLISMPDPDLAAGMYEWAGGYLEEQGYRQYEISNWARSVPDVKYQLSGGEDEVSSFACRHNLQTWRNQPYFGCGAGAHGYVGGLRYSNVLRIKTYLDRLSPDHPALYYLIPDHLTPDYRFPAAIHHHPVTRREEMQETMMLGLRLVGEGVAEADFRERFGLGIAEAFPKDVDELLRLGLVEWVDSTLTPCPSPGGRGDGVRLRLTPHARLVANQVFMRFVG